MTRTDCINHLRAGHSMTHRVSRIIADMLAMDQADSQLLLNLLDMVRKDRDALRAENARLRERLNMAREFAVGRLHVVWRSEGSWALCVPGTGYVLNRDGRWEYEPRPSDRDDAFLARTRYTLDEALDVACAMVEREAKECKACFGSSVIDDGRWGGIADTTPCSECGGTGVVESTHDVERCECQGG